MRLIIVFLLNIGCIARADVFNLNPFNSSFSPKTKTTIEVKNMPPIKSQDTLGVCFAAAASTLHSAENCRFNKISDCSKTAEKDMFSILDLSQFGWSTGGGSASTSYTYEVHEGGRIEMVTRKIGQYIGSSTSEECMSIDKALSKIGGANEGQHAQQVFWDGLRRKFKDLKAKCPNCTSDTYSTGGNDQANELANYVNQNLNLKKSNSEILAAFGEESYELFLFQILFPKECLRAKEAIFSAQGKVQVDTYPKSGTGNYAAAIKQIKETLKNGRPLGLDGICLAQNITKECINNKHAVVIAGYRTVCDKKNECHDANKVINSWGQSWQDKNSDGWIDAKSVLDSTFYKEGILSWFADK